MKCSSEDYDRLTRLRDQLITFKSMASNLDFAVRTERWLPSEYKDFYLKVSRMALSDARKLESKIKELEEKCFVGKKEIDEG